MMLPLEQSLANHLWQSTLVGCVAGLLALALRTSHARARHVLWMPASLKFLVPFFLLIGLGGQFGWQNTTPGPAPRLPVVIEEISQPFTTAAASSGEAVVVLDPHLPVLALAVWVAGAATTS